VGDADSLGKQLRPATQGHGMQWEVTATCRWRWQCLAYRRRMGAADWDSLLVTLADPVRLVMKSTRCASHIFLVYRMLWMGVRTTQTSVAR